MFFINSSTIPQDLVLPSPPFSTQFTPYLDFATTQFTVSPSRKDTMYIYLLDLFLIPHQLYFIGHTPLRGLSHTSSVLKLTFSHDDRLTGIDYSVFLMGNIPKGNIFTCCVYNCTCAVSEPVTLATIIRATFTGSSSMAAPEAVRV